MNSAQSTPNQASKSALIALLSIVLVDLIGFGVVLPILPYYAREFGASAFELSWLMTSYALLQFLLAPVWGRISDIHGRRPVLLLTLLGGVVSLVILGSARSFAWLLAGRILSGIFSANISVALAFITDVTGEKDRSRGMGYIGACFGVGFILGPVLGGLLSRYGYATPILAAAGLAGLNLVGAWLRLPEPPHRVPSRTSFRLPILDRDLVARAFTSARSRGAIPAYFLLTFAATQLEVTFALFLKERFSYGPETAGICLASMGITTAVVQGGLIGRLTRTFGSRQLIVAGSLGSAFALFALAQVTALGWLVGALILIALFQGLVHPSLMATASLGADAGDRGGALGIFHSFGSLARVFGPVTAGVAFDRLGMQGPMALASALALGVAAIGYAVIPRGEPLT